MASAAAIAAGFRLNMNAPRDAADTVSDCGRLERGRFITPGRKVNLSTRGGPKVGNVARTGTSPRSGGRSPQPGALSSASGSDSRRPHAGRFAVEHTRWLGQDRTDCGRGRATPHAVHAGFRSCRANFSTGRWERALGHVCTLLARSRSRAAGLVREPGARNRWSRPGARTPRHDRFAPRGRRRGQRGLSVTSNRLSLTTCDVVGCRNLGIHRVKRGCCR